MKGKSTRSPAPPPHDAPSPAARSGLSTDRRLVRLLSGDSLGVDGRPVEVQVDLSKRIHPDFKIVGLPGRSTQESRDRIKTAILNAGFWFPAKDRILVNLAPAFVKKCGAVFDLPVALGILVASGQVRATPEELVAAGFLGELGLQGELRPIPGALIVAEALRKRGVRRVVVPRENADEVGRDPEIDVCVAADLHAAIRALKGDCERHVRAPRRMSDRVSVADFADVRGQEATKRGLLVVAAGGHNLLLSGPPGVGKTMLARRLPGILPDLEFREAMEVTRIQSARGLLDADAPDGARPFRAPHHTISYAGLVGGGNPPLPGEISLAHRGVLFLDELPEFDRRVLETLRQPIETGSIAIVRSSGTVVFPARFHLVAAMNPCPCGYAGQSRVPCTCSPGAVKRYRQRISGPLLDRIDILLEVAQPSAADVLAGADDRRASGLGTQEMRAAVLAARERQLLRWGDGLTNDEVPQQRLLARDSLHPRAGSRLQSEAERRRLSARAIGRIVRLARTIADLDGRPRVEDAQILEALGLHRPDWEADLRFK